MVGSVGCVSMALLQNKKRNKTNNMTLEELNELNDESAQKTMMQCCTSSAWINQMVESRPFYNRNSMKADADQIWSTLTEFNFLEAFDGHPKIGDVNSLRAKYANTKALASGEQSAVNQATETVIADLKRGNEDYFDKFGFIFIVCATGKSATQMLNLLLERLPNDKATELANAAEEQRKIFHLRLEKLL